MAILLVASQVAWLVFVVWLFNQFARERESLLNRIQAPEYAVAQSLTEGESPGPLHVGFDDDEDYFKAVEER